MNPIHFITWVEGVWGLPLVCLRSIFSLNRLAQIGIYFNQALAFQDLILLGLNLIYLVESSRGKVLDLATELTTQGTTDLTMALTILFECTKHIEVDCHDIRKAFDDKIIITLPHVTTDPKLPTFSLNLFRE